jgi:hypothetical protein
MKVVNGRLKTRPLFPEKEMVAGATFSSCRKWRYSLWRVWDKQKQMVTFIGLNPSTATENENDPTITRCINFADAWGYGGMYMANIFAYRATDPKKMKAFSDPVGKKNDQWLIKMSQTSAITVAAWGAHGMHLNRGDQVVRLLKGMQLYCLGRTQNNQPRHPLYLCKDLKPVGYYK